MNAVGQKMSVNAEIRRNRRAARRNRRLAQSRGGVGGGGASGGGGGLAPSIQRYAAPRAVYSTASTPKSTTKNVTGSEMSVELDDSTVFRKLVFPLCPGNSEDFPKLSAECSQWQAFKFKWVRLTWTPAIPYDTAGQIGFCVVPYAETADEIESFDQLIVQPKCQYGNIFSYMGETFGPETMSKQYQQGGWTVRVPIENVDTLDRSQVQGFLVVGVRGCAATGTGIQGSLVLTYDVDFYKPTLRYGMTPAIDASR